jgi:hypothetical protein
MDRSPRTGATELRPERDRFAESKPAIIFSMFCRRGPAECLQLANLLQHPGIECPLTSHRTGSIFAVALLSNIQLSVVQRSNIRVPFIGREGREL